MLSEKFKMYLKNHKIKKLNIGCNKQILDSWLNTDLKENNEVLYLDAKKKFPFNSKTFDYVYSEHLIEHLSYNNGLNFLNECFRVLKINGKIRIATPDLKVLIQLYNLYKTPEQKEYIRWMTDNYLPKEMKDYKAAFIINNAFYNFKHKFIYDFDLLKQHLKKAGFTNIERHAVKESEDTNLQNLEKNLEDIKCSTINAFETLVIEAIKKN